MGSRGKAPAEFEAEPHSATADQAVQNNKRRIAKLRLVQMQYRRSQTAPLFYPPAQSKIRKERSDFAAHRPKAQICVLQTMYKHKTNHVGSGVLDSPFLPIHTCDIRTNDGRGEHRSPAFVRLQGLYKFKPRHSPNGTSRTPSPTFGCYGFVCRKIAGALCGESL